MRSLQDLESIEGIAQWWRKDDPVDAEGQELLHRIELVRVLTYGARAALTRGS